MPPLAYGNLRSFGPLPGRGGRMGIAQSVAGIEPQQGAAMAPAGAPSTVPAQTPAANPFAGRFGGLLGSNRFRAGDYISQLLGEGTKAGALNPDFLRRLLRRQALANSDAARRRAAVTGRLAGLDPFQQRQAMVEGDIGASHDLTGALNQADLSGYQQYQELIRSLLSGERGFEQQRALQRLANQGQNDNGALAGQIIGGVASRFIP